jgi:hypothetical protein
LTVLIDSDVLIDYLRGHEPARRRLRQAIRRGPVYGSVITRAEVLAGMRDAEAAPTLAMLRSLSWLPVDLAIADHAGALAHRHRSAHPTIGLPDYLIAATADLLGLRLLTRNVRHFPMLPRLRPAY